SAQDDPDEEMEGERLLRGLAEEELALLRVPLAVLERVDLIRHGLSCEELSRERHREALEEAPHLDVGVDEGRRSETRWLPGSSPAAAGAGTSKATTRARRAPCLTACAPSRCPRDDCRCRWGSRESHFSGRA